MLRKLALSLAVAGIIGTSNAHALGLGEIQIKSALNEPLQAEIQLLQLRDVDTDQIRPRMANIDEFALAGIEKLRFLSDVKFEVKQGPGGRGIITMQSNTPVKEPFLNFLVEVNWPSGRLVREYTVLLDPPVYDPTPEPVAVQPALTQPATVAAPVTAKQMEPAAPVSNIRTRMNPKSQVYVDVNDTLWNIAKRNKPNASITEAQMMLALQRKNPEAFEGNNVNRLKAGVVLDLPSLEEVQALTPKQANEEFWRQTQAWKQGRSITPVAPEQLNGSADKQAKPTKKDDQVAATQAQGQLKIVSPDKQEDSSEASSATGGDAAEADADLIAKNQKLEAELAAALESVDQIQRENEELTGRVDALAQQMESLQRLLELKDQQLAELQAELEAAKAQPVAPVTPPTPLPETKPGLLEQFGMYIYGAGAALVALLVGLLVMMRRRKNKDEEPEIEESAEEVAAVSEAAPEEIEPVEEVAEDVVEESIVEEVSEETVEEISDEDLDDLDLDLDMDLDEVDSSVDSTIDDDEFDLGLDDIDADDLTQPDAVAEVASDLVEEDVHADAEEVDDALDSILGEEAESLDLDDIEEEPVADDLDALLAEVDAGAAEDELEFDLSAEESSDADEVEAIADDLDDLLAEVDSEEDELEFDLSAEESAEKDVPEAVADDLDDLLAEVESAEEDELEFDLTDAVEQQDVTAEEEFDFDLDLEDAVVEEAVQDEIEDVAAPEELEFDVAEALSGEDVQEEQSEQPVEEDEAFADLEALLDEADADTAEEEIASSDAESEFADLEELLGEEVELDEAVIEAEEADDTVADLDELLAEAGGIEEDVAVDEVPVEQPDPAELSELHPELENLLEDLEGEDVVLEEQALSLDADDALESELAGDLDVELDSELEQLLNDAGDDSVALDSEDSDDAFDGLNLLEGADEVETKLDLARAYIDMEDVDGAKDILQEILKEGSDTQQQEANNLLGMLES